MKLAELVRAVAEALATDRHASVVLHMRKGGIPRTFPYGVLLEEMRVKSGAVRAYRYPAEKVLSWLVEHNLVHITCLRPHGANGISVEFQLSGDALNPSGNSLARILGGGFVPARMLELAAA